MVVGCFLFIIIIILTGNWYFCFFRGGGILLFSVLSAGPFFFLLGVGRKQMILCCFLEETLACETKKYSRGGSGVLTPLMSISFLALEVTGYA
jgi:hypothetical protein